MRKCEIKMTSNFTTGLPEIDRLTGSEIESGTFFLVTGNDDEGMSAFLTEIKKSNGSSGKKERKEKNENGEEPEWEILKTDFKEDVFEKAKRWSRLFEKKEVKNQKTKEREAENEQNEIQKIILIESLGELFQTNGSGKKAAPPLEYSLFVNLIKNMKSEKSNPQKQEGARCVVIGCLHQKTIPKRMEKRLAHLSDHHFQFKMKERNGKIEREIRIWKYRFKNEEEKEEEEKREEEEETKNRADPEVYNNPNEEECKNPDGAKDIKIRERRNEMKSVSGTVLKYEMENNKIKIENKKRIY